MTQLRSFGHCFNPVSFYYCFEPGGERVQALVAEVTNTPWGERHAYVIEGKRARLGGARRCSSTRRCTSRRSWAWTIATTLGAAAPGQTLSVHIASSRAGATVFDATLSLRRRELTRRVDARGSPARYPLATVRVLALIYAHALGLKLAGGPSTAIRRRDGHERLALLVGSCRVLLRRITVGSLIVVEGDERRVYGSGAPDGDRPGSTRRGRGRCCCAAAAGWPRPTPKGCGIRPISWRWSGWRRATPAASDRLRSRLAPLRVAAAAARALLRRSTKRRRRRDIAAHYDLGNELFSRMLDPTMSYSCAFFEGEGMTLEQAQIAKLERVCEQLDLGPAIACSRSGRAGVPSRSTPPRPAAVT